MLFFAAALASSVAIIGGGPSGIVAAKEAKQSGLKVTVFEQGNSIGGLWRPDGGKTWDNMRINNSRNACTFSDYEWQDSNEDFPSSKEIYRYLCSYAKAFNIQDEVLLNSKVSKIEKEGNQWRVEWLRNGEVNASLFDSVIVCSGLYSRAFIPQISGQETFSGSIIHAQDYKNSTPYKNKRVVVVGNALSGCEIAAEIAQKAEKVFHLYHRPCTLFSRYLKEEESNRRLPYDLLLERRSLASQYQGLTVSQCREKYNKLLHAFCRRQEEFCPALTLPTSLNSPTYVVVSDSYPSEVHQGRIALRKASIEQIKGNTLYLSDGSDLCADCIVFCTGYRTDLSFFAPSIQEQIEYQPDDPLQPVLLYKTIFHPDLPNMAFVGMGRFGINFGIVELQARWASMVLSGNISLPITETMKEGIKAEQNIRELNPKPQFSRGYIRFCDDLAKQIGVLPDWAHLQKGDPLLYEKLWNGPFTTASYRLIGFGSNPDLALKRIEKLYRYAGEPLQNPECIYQTQY